MRSSIVKVKNNEECADGQADREASEMRIRVLSQKEAQQCIEKASTKRVILG